MFTAVWSVINVFVAFLYNLISDIVGGVEVTLAEKPPAERRRVGRPTIDTVSEPWLRWADGPCPGSWGL